MKTVIVTGASRGIGLAIMQHVLKSDSVFVVGTGRSASVGNEGLTRLVEDSRFSYIQGDVCEAATQQRCIDAALAFGYGLYAVVFNAGVIDPVERIANIDMHALTQSLFDTNLFSIVAPAKLAIPHLNQNTAGAKGRIIFVSSGAAVSVYVGWGAYCMSKAALNMLAMTLAKEEPDIIYVATEMQQTIRSESSAAAMGPEAHGQFKKLLEDSQLLDPAVPGNLVANLVLDRDAHLSGQFLSWNDERLREYL
ncbi:short-chain dehydrogenase [Chytriomyces cf. hyalinus JEL632]|nr:short-chain dehydrogenase [Chytriomyces cf. hyalinus JEL632]